MDALFEWHDKYSVGNPLIDGQHRVLFEIGNKLHGSMDEATTKQVVMELFIYTRKHFTSEENMMRDGFYPKLSRHKKLHEDLIEKLSVLSTQTDFNTERYCRV